MNWSDSPFLFVPSCKNFWFFTVTRSLSGILESLSFVFLSCLLCRCRRHFHSSSINSWRLGAAQKRSEEIKKREKNKGRKKTRLKCFQLNFQVFFCLHFIRFAYASLVTQVSLHPLPHGSYNLFSFPPLTMTTNRTHHIATRRGTFFFPRARMWKIEFFNFFFPFHFFLSARQPARHGRWIELVLSICPPKNSITCAVFWLLMVDVLTWNEKLVFYLNFSFISWKSSNFRKLCSIVRSPFSSTANSMLSDDPRWQKHVEQQLALHLD